MTNAETVSENAFFVAGGTLAVNAPSYIERHADAELFAALQNGAYATSSIPGKSASPPS